jgi:hypothetical protein
MHADDVDPINVGHRVGDESIHIVPIPGVPLPIKYRTDGRCIVGRDGR